MPLQISEFKRYAQIDGAVIPVAYGPPASVSSATFTGVFTVGEGVRLVRISGSGTITWSSSVNPEAFEGVEFRRVQPGIQFTVS